MLIRFSEVNAYSIFIIVRPAFERLTLSAVRSLILYMITKECQHIFCPDKPAVKEPERFKRRKKEGEPQLKLTSLKMSVRGIILIKIGRASCRERV